MGGFTTGDGQSPETIMFADSCCFDGTQRSTVMNQDGQVWIGASASPFVRPSFITSLDGSIDVSNGPGTIDISSAASDLHVARFIVASSTNGTGANFTTISAAIAAAQGTGVNCTIWLQPGTYTEDFTLPAGITLTAARGDDSNPNVTIIGKVTMTAAGTSTISNIRLRTNSDNCISITGAAAVVLNIENCFIDVRNNTAILVNNANAHLNILRCEGDSFTTGIALFTITAGAIDMNFCQFYNTLLSTTTSNSAGSCLIRFSIIHWPLSTSGTGTLHLRSVRLYTAEINTTSLTAAGGISQIETSNILSGTAIAIVATSQVEITNSQVGTSNAAAISGAGTLMYSNVSFRNSSAITTTTQTPLASSNDGVVIKTPGAYPYTTVPQDGLILVDTSSARTITPLASPTTGQKHIIKDNVGSAAANNITITPSGKNVDGAASTVVNVNYGSVTIIYNGTEWSVV